MVTTSTRGGEPETLDEVDVMILGTFKAEVLPRLGPSANAEGTILRRIFKWSTEGVYLTPDAEHVENLAGLLEVKRKAEPGTLFQCHWSRAAERVGATDSCRGTGIALYLGPDRYDLQFATKELEQAFDDEAQASGPVLGWHGRRGSFLRLSGRAKHGVGLDRR